MMFSSGLTGLPPFGKDYMNSPVLYTQIIYRMAQSDKKFESYDAVEKAQSVRLGSEKGADNARGRRAGCAQDQMRGPFRE
jgi:hypothetical protein